MNEFTFDLQRFEENAVTISSLSSLSTYATTNPNVYTLTSGTYNIDDNTTNGSAIELDKPIVIPTGAVVTINLAKKASGFKEASGFSGGDINSLIQIQGNEQLTITAAVKFAKNNAKIQSSTVDSAISIVAANNVNDKAKLTIESTNESDKNTATSTPYPCIVGKTYGIKADSAADIKIYGGDIHSTGDNGAGILQANGTLEISRTKATIYGKSVGIQFDSTDTSTNGNLNISAGEIYAKASAGTSATKPSGTAILIDNDGVVANISDAMTTSNSSAKYMVAALEIKDLQSTEAGATSFGTTSTSASTVNISGGTLKSYTSGDNCHAIKNDSNVSVTITSGTFKGKLSGTGYNITGGTFQSNPGENFDEIYLNGTKSYVVKNSTPANVVAESTDSEGKKHYYTSLNYVARYASAGDEITLTADVADANVVINKNLTLNLDGHQITKSSSIEAPSLFIVDNSANFTIKDTNTTSKGTIDDTANTLTDNSFIVAVSKGTFTLSDVTLKARKCGVYIYDTSTTEGEEGTTTNNSFTMNSGTITSQNLGVNVSGSGATFTMNNGTISSTTAGANDVNVFTGAKFTMNNGNISTVGVQGSGVFVAGKNATFEMKAGNITAQDYFAVTTNGTNNDAYKGTVINISGGSITSNGAPAIYNPAVDSKLTISSGTITGTTGVEVRAGSIEVSGDAKISSTAKDKFYYHQNGNGSTSYGAGITVAQHTTNNAITVNINGGTVEGYTALAVVNPHDQSDNAPIISVKGGTLTSTSTTTKETVTHKDSETLGGTTYNNYNEITGKNAVYISDSRVKAATVSGGTFNGALSKKVARNVRWCCCLNCRHRRWRRENSIFLEARRCNRRSKYGRHRYPAC